MIINNPDKVDELYEFLMEQKKYDRVLEIKIWMENKNLEEYYKELETSMDENTKQKMLYWEYNTEEWYFFSNI